MTVCPRLIAGTPPARDRASVTPVPLTATPPTPMHAPSVAATAKRAAAGRRAATASSASSNTIVSAAPLAATLAETGIGITMSSVVACAGSERGPVPWPLIAATR